MSILHFYDEESHSTDILALFSIISGFPKTKMWTFTVVSKKILYEQSSLMVPVTIVYSFP